jgi:hypothetical protein
MDVESVAGFAIPKLIDYDGNTLHDMVRERFGDRADEAMGIHYQLIDRAGVYLTDLHGRNIKFKP